MISVSVSDCSNSTAVILQGQDTSCYAEILIDTIYGYVK